MPLDVSSELESKYTATKRSPAELYTFWNNYNTYYLTSSDQEITFNGHTFEPARIKRGNTQFSADLAVSTISVEVNYLNEEVIEYITTAPIDQTYLRIEKIFLDQDPYESIVYFIGIFDNVSFQSQNANITASGIEKLLRRPYPKLRYQPRCSLKLYSTMCGVDKNSFSVQRTVQAISSDGRQITLDTLAGFASDYFVLGYVATGESGERMITSQSSNIITVRSRIPNLSVYDVITIYAGCSKLPSVCQNKFNNLGNASLNGFLGFIYIPNDNPATWVNT